MLTTFFFFFTQKLRLSKPWKYKVPLLISLPYFVVLNGSISNEIFLKNILAAFATIIGFAGIAYLSNDLSDREKDKLANKPNAIEGLTNGQIALLYLAFLFITFLPWKYLPFNSISILLIALELFLFLAYALPPFRLKEKGLLGLLTDALYAHVIPALLASWTFILLIGFQNFPHFKPFMIALGTWQLISGLRNILSHQIKDFDNDHLSNTQTWVTQQGLSKSNSLLKKVFIPLELISFIAFLGLIQIQISYLFPIVILYWIHALRKFNHKKKDQTESESKHFTNIFLDNFYIKWLPLIILSGIVLITTEVKYVLFLHLLLFVNLPKTFQSIGNRYQNTKIYQWLFDFNAHYRGMLIHFFVLALYTSLFCGVYFILHYFIKDETRFFSLQHLLSKLLLLTIFSHLTFILIIRKKESIQVLKDFLFEKSSAYNLAVFRILFFYLLIKSYYSEVFTSFEAWSHLPDSAKVSLPFMGWIIDLLPIYPELYHAVGMVGLVLAFTGLLGFQTKWTLKLYVPVALYLWGVPCFFGKLNHHHIMVWIPILFAFSRCSDVLSIDALIRKIRKRDHKPIWSVEYALPLKVIWILLAIIYCFSGLHKLWDTGLYWALSDNLINQIQLEWVENYDVVSSIRIDQYPTLLKLLGVGLILFEITYPLFLLKPATRFVNLIGSWVLHLTAGYFLNIDFGYLRKIHFSLLNWEKWFNVFNVKRQLSQTTNSNEEDTISQLKKYPIFYVAAGLIGFNLVFSIFGISSWPFSAYPAYSGIVKNEVQLIEMKAFDSNGNPIDVKAIGKEQQFRWENIRPFEERIAESVHSGDTSLLKQQLDHYWSLWTTKVPSLKSVQKVEMRLVNTSLVPEKRQRILHEKYLGTVNLVE